MSYAFERPSRLAVEIRRVAVERLDNALDELGEDALREDRMVAVHTARKDIKKTRSLMRLIRGSLADDDFRAQNNRLRSAAHELAAVRETDAKVVSLSKLTEDRAAEMSEACVTAAREWGELLRPSEGPADVSAEATKAAELVRQVRDDARLWSLGYGSWEIIEPGLRRGYRQGLRGLREAEASPDDETVHEWRKRVKDMWYSLRLLEGAWPPVLGVMADQAHRLSELLGDHHDLGVHLAAATLVGAGWQTLVLGADTPIASAEAAIDELEPALVVVGACV